MFNLLMNVKMKVAQFMSNSLGPHGLYSPWNSPGQNTWVGSLSLFQGNLSNLGIEPRSPALQADSLPAEPPGKAKNTGVSSLSLLQWIFLTQESNRGLLHCRWILYQLSCQESPICLYLLLTEDVGNPQITFRELKCYFILDCYQIQCFIQNYFPK